MNASDYASRRDVFTKALSALKDVEIEFCEAVDNWEGVEGRYDVARQLDAEGKALTGEEYRALWDAIELMERLIGRAHESAVSLERFV